MGHNHCEKDTLIWMHTDRGKIRENEIERRGGTPLEKGMLYVVG